MSDFLKIFLLFKLFTVPCLLWSHTNHIGQQSTCSLLPFAFPLWLPFIISDHTNIEVRLKRPTSKSSMTTIGTTSVSSWKMISQKILYIGNPMSPPPSLLFSPTDPPSFPPQQTLPPFLPHRPWSLPPSFSPPPPSFPLPHTLPPFLPHRPSLLSSPTDPDPSLPPFLPHTPSLLFSPTHPPSFPPPQTLIPPSLLSSPTHPPSFSPPHTLPPFLPHRPSLLFSPTDPPSFPPPHTLPPFLPHRPSLLSSPTHPPSFSPPHTLPPFLPHRPWSLPPFLQGLIPLDWSLDLHNTSTNLILQFQCHTVHDNLYSVHTE